MTLANRIARIDANRSEAASDTQRSSPQRSSPLGREAGFGTLLLGALVPSLVWAALAYPFGAIIAFAVLGPIGAIVLAPYLLLRRNRRTSPKRAERSAILDLLNLLNPFR